MMYVRPIGVVCLALGLLMGAGNALAQVAHDTRLLNEAERTHYRELLSKSTDSAERAKVKSEMNRLIQTRKMERHKAASSAPNPVEPSINPEPGAQ